MEDFPQRPAGTIDIELLIQEIKKRKVLWDNTTVGYNQRFRKVQLWEEVNSAVFDDWNELSSAEKWIRADETKKRWRTLRDTYNKEVTNEKRLLKGKGKPKKPYKLSSQLSFLKKIFDKDNAPTSDEESEDEHAGRKKRRYNNDIIDVETLIREVQSRPILWNKQTQLNEKGDLLARDRYWDEICTILFHDWSELRQSEKAQRCINVKRRWRTLRDTFHKEVNHARRVEAGLVRPRRARYRYSAELSFLHENIEEDVVENTQIEIELPSSNYSLSSLEDPWTEPQASAPPPSEPHAVRVRTYDEDVCFTEMLVPMLKKLNDEQKHYAQVKILNVLRRARQFDPLGGATAHQTQVVVHVKNETSSP